MIFKKHIVFLLFLLFPLQIALSAFSEGSSNFLSLENHDRNSGLTLNETFSDKYSPRTLHSQLLKEDPAAQNISKGGTIDLSQITLYDLDYPIYVHSLPHKIYVGLTLIGYQKPEGNTIKSSQSVLSLLERFQKDQNLNPSGLLDSETLLSLDNAVYKKEQQIFNYSKKADKLFQSIAPSAKELQFSEDYIAWIFIRPLEVLPQHLIKNLSSADYFRCIYYQCAGTVKRADNSSFPFVDEFTYFEEDFIFYPDIFPNQLPNSKKATLNPAKSSGMFYVVLHEFAHYLDITSKDQEDFDPELNGRLIDTREFKAISFISSKEDGYFERCSQRKTNDVKDFITRYGFDGGGNTYCESLGYGSDYGRPNEDFADSFAAYVLAGTAFREAAMKNETILEKYEWLKKNVFAGKEYDTNLAYGTGYSFFGCKDALNTDLLGGPFYISCNDDFYWDGSIDVL